MGIKIMTQQPESQDEDSEEPSAAAGASGGVVEAFSGVSIRVRKELTIIYI